MRADIDRLAGATETAIIIPVGAAERTVGRFRKKLDQSAARGMSAHVTVLYPFVAPDRIDAETLAEAGAALAEVPAFDCAFTQVKWFGDDVVWLSPEPDRHFRELTRSVWRRFPDCPPYRGEHSDSIPHLTIGSVAVANLESLKRAAVAIQPELPIPARVDHARLVAASSGSWRTVTEFPLPG
ncbi:2'-5' RNA ligase family protein [Actinomadura sp. DC4]|uniref:2'-5' RNA ligase family protein n=1 Tax=Actinomadura sp. DC4 TaxID=3055069 RepID=UPI0025B0FD85|nr:2'-5' RNA ligase family protein [Actinomadura sp. DC4]MDN3357673.1 2'-5' RNA ligase family protein [Actinomadura sp. DC4]